MWKWCRRTLRAKWRFNVVNWPNSIGQIDLGDRVIDVIPTPGHYPSHVAYYDRQTGLFFSGDFLLPGRFLIEDTNADLSSAGVSPNLSSSVQLLMDLVLISAE